MYIDVTQHLEDLKARLGKASKTYSAALQAYVDHPDISAHMMGGKVRLCGASLNPYVDQLDFDRGQDLYVYPFIEDGGALLYSDPPYFYIGSRNTEGFGVYPAVGWTEEMQDANINSDIIKKVKDFLSANLPYGLPEDDAG